jgi:hypothetical protein
VVEEKQVAFSYALDTCCLRGCGNYYCPFIALRESVRCKLTSESDYMEKLRLCRHAAHRLFQKAGGRIPFALVTLMSEFA